MRRSGDNDIYTGAHGYQVLIRGQIFFEFIFFKEENGFSIHCLQMIHHPVGHYNAQ